MKNLTKTDFIAYLDAPRHLWAIKNNKLPEQEINAYLQHLFEQGYDVEKYAERYITECLLRKYKAKEADVLLQPKQVDGEFEARTDVLVRNPETDKWDMYEIKSSTSVSKQHRYDATFQTLVFQKQYSLGQIYILHLNRDYIKHGEINLESLFTATDITAEVEKIKDDVHLLRYEALDYLREDDFINVPACIRPKQCPCLELCHADLPDYSIYDVNNLTASEKKIRELEEQGIKSVYDIPNSFPLTEKQSFQVQVAKANQASVDKITIQNELSTLEYPIYFVDYESFNPAIPMYDGYKPYDQIPFQWSLHIQNEPNGELEHHEFIETEEIDPIPNFLNELRGFVQSQGTIIVWNKTFEATQNKRMAEIHPEFVTFCEDMNRRIYDLMDIFRNGLYADPKFKGSYSIKRVLPVIVPELTYDELDIAEGATAMASWNEMVHSDISVEQKENIKKNLLEYCKLDTFAMVRIFEELNNGNSL